MFLGLLLKEGFIRDTQVEKNALEFIEYRTRTRAKEHGLLYTQADIDTVNTLLDVVAFELK